MEEMTRTQKLLGRAFDASKENESILAVYSDGEGGSVQFAGDPKQIAEGFAHIIKGGAAKGANDKEKDLLNALLNAMYAILADGGYEADYFATLIANTVTEAQKDWEEKKKQLAKKLNEVNKAVEDKNLHAPKDFNPTDKDCRECDSFFECSLLWLRDKLNHKPTNGHNKKNGNKKNRKK